MRLIVLMGILNALIEFYPLGDGEEIFNIMFPELAIGASGNDTTGAGLLTPVSGPYKAGDIVTFANPNNTAGPEWKAESTVLTADGDTTSVPQKDGTTKDQLADGASVSAHGIKKENQTAGGVKKELNEKTKGADGKEKGGAGESGHLRADAGAIGKMATEAAGKLAADRK